MRLFAKVESKIISNHVHPSLVLLGVTLAGSPIRTQVTKDFYAFTASSFFDADELEKVRWGGTQPLPLKLFSLPTQPDSLKETDNLHDTDSDDEFRTTSKENIQEEANEKEQQSSREEYFPRSKPKMSSRHGRGSSKQGSRHNTATPYPDDMTSSGIRWQVAHLYESKDDDKNVKKKKKKKPHDPSESGSAAIVAGICAGILVLLCIVSGLVRLW